MPVTWLFILSTRLQASRFVPSLTRLLPLIASPRRSRLPRCPAVEPLAYPLEMLPIPACPLPEPTAGAYFSWLFRANFAPIPRQLGLDSGHFLLYT